ncbi:MAG: adenine deaminase [Fusobacterium ulcerans]|uniref:adenine deaminase n=1 Tax=Fusobacterium ulcerans TaxID=861 RepID=UPI003A885B88
MKIDLLIKDVKIYNSYLKKFKEANVAILDKKILHVDTKKEIEFDAEKIIDGKNQYMVPGLIDIHMHIESSMMTPAPFCHQLAKNGVTTIVAEPHEIANVFGDRGIYAMIKAEDNIDTSIFYGIPSSVPSTSEELETTGAVIDCEGMKKIAENPNVICVGEVMNYRKVIVDDTLEICRFIEYVKKEKPTYAIEGHCPKLLDLELSKFLYLGINGDHTEHTMEEFKQRFENGMFVEIQAKSIEKELIDYIKENNLYEHFSFVTDDVMADTFLNEGHLNVVMKKAVKEGLRIEDAIYSATYTPARRMHLLDRGVLAPGKKADFLFVEDLEKFEIKNTFINGKEVYNSSEEKKYIPTTYRFPEDFYRSVHVKNIKAEDIKIPVETTEKEVMCRVIEVSDGSTRTKELIRPVPVKDGYLDWESSEYCLIVVFERHGKNGNIGFGLVTGDSIKKGAIATTYAHDHHNLMVIGKTAVDIIKAANRIIEIQGGICAVENGNILAEVELPVAGILSEKSVEELGKEVEKLRGAMKALGYKHYNPIMSLCTLSLPVSPALKITDKGLIDVAESKVVSLIV